MKQMKIDSQENADGTNANVHYKDFTTFSLPGAVFVYPLPNCSWA